jgi:hypothetical protein
MVCKRRAENDERERIIFLLRQPHLQYVVHEAVVVFLVRGDETFFSGSGKLGVESGHVGFAAAAGGKPRCPVLGETLEEGQRVYRRIVPLNRDVQKLAERLDLFASGWVL